MMIRAGVSLLRRVSGAVLPVAALTALGCSDTTRPGPLEVPPFVFVSDSAGVSGLYLFDDGNVVRLSGSDQEDDQPHSASGRIVFTSRRDGNFEIYIADTLLAGQQRLTNDPSTDREPALDPTGTTIAFVSSRSGTPRIWLMDVSGANPRALDTGTPTFTPEGAPAWSPSGDRIAFTSTRTNTSQVFVIDTTSGQAVQWSHEAGGAFTPTWGSNTSVAYVALLGEPRVVLLASPGGTPTRLASGDRVLGDPACAADVCLAVVGADTDDGDLIAMGAGRDVESVLVRAANDRHPAFLVP
jgi:Tol biopolymer transport system component